MEPANTIIAKCGGISAVANWLGLNHSTVLRWTYTKGGGGTGGIVPAKHQLALMAGAAAAGVSITPSDFFPSLERPANDRSTQSEAA